MLHPFLSASFLLCLNSVHLSHWLSDSTPLSDVSSNSYGNIMCSQLNALISQFEANHATVPFTSRYNHNLDFHHAMQSIVDQRNITFDGVSIDSIFNLDNPLACAAGTKNNPDILSQGQMFKAEDDHENFISSQLPEIQGLVDADVFEFHSMSDLPPRAQLLNAIWSYHCK